MELKKTLAMNTLFDFYGPLLTKKQQEYLSLYYQNDFSLGEIAENFDISRQAVYDNINRSEKLLKNYEDKLHLVRDFKIRNNALKNIKAYIDEKYSDDTKLIELIQSITKDTNED